MTLRSNRARSVFAFNGRDSALARPLHALRIAAEQFFNDSRKGEFVRHPAPVDVGNARVGFSHPTTIAASLAESRA